MNYFHSSQTYSFGSRRATCLRRNLSDFRLDAVNILFHFVPMRGRPPSWNPFAQLLTASWIEAARIDDKGRVSLPTAARRRVSWIMQGESAPLLADLGPGGYAELSLWMPYGAARLEEITALAQQASATERSRLILAAMDRFLQVSLEQGCRLHLPVNLRAHLDPEGQGTIRVIVRDDRLWLWSERGWQASRAERLRSINAILQPAEAPVEPD